MSREHVRPGCQKANAHPKVATTSRAPLGAPSSALSAENAGRLGTLGAIGEIRKSTAKGFVAIFM